MNRLIRRIVIVIAVMMGVVIGGWLILRSTKADGTKFKSNISVEQKSKDLACQIVKDMYNQDFKKVLSLAIKDFPLNEEMLKDVYDNILVYLPYVGTENVIYESDKETVSVNITVESKEEFVNWKMVFDSEYKLNGLNIDVLNMKDKINTKETEYFSEEKVTVGEYDLTGILTLPKNKGKVPIIIIVSGSGPSSANGTLLLNRPYADIAYGLAKNGIATLRYNDRYYERKDVWSKSDTIYDETINDISSAIKMLSKDDRVDKDNIYIVGHSLGGMIAPRIAELNPEVKGIISMAGSLRNFADIYFEQQEKIIELDTTITDKKEKHDTLKKEYDEIKNISEDSEDMMWGCSKTYWRSLNSLNVKETLKKLNIPMLIMQGGKDVQVISDIDYKGWQEELSGRSNVHFKLYDGLNHLFTKSKGYGFGMGDLEYTGINHVDDEVMNDIASFIKGYSE